MNQARIQLAYGYESWTTANHLASALARFGSCEVFGPGHAQVEPLHHDAPLLWVESGVPWMPSPKALIDRAACGVPTMAWLIDTHRGARWRLRAAACFDHVFVAQRSAVRAARNLGIEATWLPLAAPADLMEPPPPLPSREFDVAFVGHIEAGSDRARIIHALGQRFRMPPQGFVEPREMMSIYRSARVVVNIPLKEDLNMRVFEAAAAGALLVTNAMDGLDQVLPPPAYRLVEDRRPESWTAAVDAALCDQGASSPGELHALVLSAHTYDQRAAQVMSEQPVVEPRALDAGPVADALSTGLAHMGAVTAVGLLPQLSTRRRAARTAIAAAVTARRRWRQR